MPRRIITRRDSRSALYAWNAATVAEIVAQRTSRAYTDGHASHEELTEACATATDAADELYRVWALLGFVNDAAAVPAPPLYVAFGA
jgi:hypothetical protein